MFKKIISISLSIFLIFTPLIVNAKPLNSQNKSSYSIENLNYSSDKLITIQKIIRSEYGSDAYTDEGNNNLNLWAFYNYKTNAYAATGRSGTYYFLGNKNLRLVRDYGASIGSSAHGGSYWKLEQRQNTPQYVRIGTFTKDGIRLRS